MTTSAYDLLLRLFPRSFRLEYGGEMKRVFEERLGAARGFERVGAWTEAIVDVAPNAARVHADILAQDLRYSVRSLGRARGFTVTAILVAGLGVGAMTAAFSVTDRALIRPLPFPEPEKLVKVFQAEPGYSRFEPSPAHYRDWRAMNASFVDVGAYANTSVNVITGGEPLRASGAAVTANLFGVLGVRPAIGTGFEAADDVEGAPGKILLSHGLWQARFGGREDVVGSTVRLDDEAYTVTGVMAPDFAFPDRSTRLWVPIRFGPRAYEDRDNHYLHVVGRMKPGVRLDGARADMSTVNARLKAQNPGENEVTVVALRDQVSAQSRLMLMALVGASVCVLLIASTNLASLLVARSLRRRGELVVRSALGAGRERLVRQLLTDSAVLALLGGGAGLALAAILTPLLARLAPVTLPMAETAWLDSRVLAFAAIVTALTTIAFGVAPALRVSRGNEASGLREGARGSVGGGRGARAILVFSEVALSVVLLVSAGLLMRALVRVQATEPGFSTEGILTLRTSLPVVRYGPTATRAQFYDRVLEEVRALPGVASAAYTSFAPMVMRGGIWDATIPGVSDPESDNKVSVRFVTPDYFRTLSIPLIAGRDVAASDTVDTLAVAVVSESFARKYWKGADPLGRGFNVALADRTVAGVVGDIKVRGLERESEPQIYLPYRQVPDNGLVFYMPKDLAIRSTMDPALLTPRVREIVRRVDPEVPVSDVKTVTAILDDETAPRSTQLRVIGAFAFIAALLAGVGIHGLLALTVSSRQREIGVRMALGAEQRDILRLVSLDAAKLVASGAIAGLVAAYLAALGLRALLFGLSPADPPTFIAAAFVVGVMAFFGGLIPAARAVRINPVTVLRAE